MGANLQDIGWQASGTAGAVAAGGPAATAAGLAMLQRGGNAADSAVATILALSITDFGAFAIGGEVPFIIYSAEKREVKVLCGLGRAPLSQKTIDWYMANGIPADGDMKAAPVPGALDLCVTALRMYGTMSFAEVVAPTLELVSQPGAEWYPDLLGTLRRLVEAESRTTGPRDRKLQAVSDRCYRGDIAEQLMAYYRDKGGMLEPRDLAAHVTAIEDPVTVDYRGYTVCKCGTWTQGPTLCQALRLLEGFDLKGMGHLSADYIHTCTEALKLAFADRDEYYGDPLFADVPLEQLLSREYADVRRPLIDMAAASSEPRPGDPLKMLALKEGGAFRPGPGGTTTCVTADRWGNVVSATPSCNVFGNKGFGGATGITHGNRLRSLNTAEGHPNCIAPGKRPRITLTPTMVLKEGKPIAAISVAGGDLQDQTTLNVLLNFVEFGQMPRDAVTAPRFATNLHENSFNPSPVRSQTEARSGPLTLSDAVDEACRAELQRRGHTLSLTDKAIANPVMLYIDPHTQAIQAAGDPKAQRHALAFDG